ncbi:hypothetical protein [Nocardiopsis kunsanensis]|uniref:hypothetical protein n=1 Tax=Nocardiopsis kunsanensis TaxID=141693 RepID=UPI000347457C|nr:hypothetical protein [Nocardiopsis kunsanensis]
MHPTIVAPAEQDATADDLTALSPAALDALGITDHDDLFAVELEEETAQEQQARLAAAEDILDDRLTEIAHQTLTPEVIEGWIAR